MSSSIENMIPSRVENFDAKSSHTDVFSLITPDKQDDHNKEKYQSGLLKEGTDHENNKQIYKHGKNKKLGKLKE